MKNNILHNYLLRCEIIYNYNNSSVHQCASSAAFLHIGSTCFDYSACCNYLAIGSTHTIHRYLHEIVKYGPYIPGVCLGTSTAVVIELLPNSFLV